MEKILKDNRVEITQSDIQEMAKEIIFREMSKDWTEEDWDEYYEYYDEYDS